MKSTRNLLGAVEGVHFRRVGGRVFPIVAGGDGPTNEPGGDLLTLVRSKIKTQNEARQAAETDLVAATATAVSESRSDLTPDEVTARKEARDKIVAIDLDLDGDDNHEGLLARESELAGEAERRDASDALAARLGNLPAGPTGVRGINEPDIYRRNGTESFVVDLYRSQFMPHQYPDSGDRLNRHTAHVAETRDASVSSFAGLIPPQFLLDEFAPMARAGRPYSNSIRQIPLPPEGTAFTIPRGTTGTSTGVQASEGDAVSETDYDATDLPAVLRTIAGAQDVSRQAVERGQNIDLIVFADLAADYAVKLDAANLVAAIAAAGETVTYTDASPSVAELWPKIADAIQRVNSLRFMPATAIWMHPRRWGWITAPVDGDGRPLFGSNKPVTNPLGTGKAAEYGQVVGEILGVPVITDANISITAGAGNEDTILVGRAPDQLLWEDGDGTPKELRFEQPQGKKLTIELVAYGYSVYSSGRYPKSLAKITGTGLGTPTF